MEQCKENDFKKSTQSFKLNTNHGELSRSGLLSYSSCEKNILNTNNSKNFLNNKFNRQTSKTTSKPLLTSATLSCLNPNTKRAGRYFRSESEDKKQVDNVDIMRFHGLNIPKKRPKIKFNKIEYHQLFQKTFEACQGYKYISFNLIKHPHLKTKQQPNKNKDPSPPKDLNRFKQFQIQKEASEKKPKYKPVTLRDSFTGQNSSFRFSQNVYEIKNMFIGKKARQSFDRKVNRPEINKLTLVNHLGKPIKYILTQKKR